MRRRREFAILDFARRETAPSCGVGNGSGTKNAARTPKDGALAYTGATAGGNSRDRRDVHGAGRTRRETSVPPLPVLDELTPREIVRELDKHVVGQADAKRAVAIALRNRIRRQKLAPEMAEEVMPKNIFMIGPTGVGKTELARH